jgi:molecular chaperone DnaK
LTPSRSNPGWALAIDFGTRTTRAAVAYLDRGRIAEVAAIPSVVRWEPAEGRAPALRAGNPWPTRPASAWRGECAVKRRVGDERLALDGVDLALADAIAAILREVADAATAAQDGAPPGQVLLTHPGWWSAGQVGQLQQAAAALGLPAPTLMPDPVAVAHYFAGDEIAVGGHIGVLDMGDASFDVAVLRRTRDGFELIGEPDGSRSLGGADFEDRVYRTLGRRLSPGDWYELQHSPDPAWREADRRLRSDAGWAIALFSYGRVEYDVTVPAPVGRKLALTREQLMELIAADIEATVDRLAALIARAGLAAGDLAAICLAGGASETLLVSELIGDRLGQTPLVAARPSQVVSLGAARAALATRRAQLGQGHRAAPSARRQMFTPAETMPNVARDDELEAVVIMDHGRWASRHRGVWSVGCAWPQDHRDFTAITADAEIFALLDEAAAALGWATA